MTNTKSSTKSSTKTRAEEIASAQAGNDDAAARLSEKAAAKQAARNAHDDVITGRVRHTAVTERAEMLTDRDTAQRNANARDLKAKPATGTALTVCALIKSGMVLTDAIAQKGVIRVDRLHFILTDEGRAGYRFTLVTAGAEGKLARTHIEYVSTPEGPQVDTVTAQDMRTTQDNVTPLEVMKAAIEKAEAKGKLSARLADWKATIERTGKASA